MRVVLFLALFALREKNGDGGGAWFLHCKTTLFPHVIDAHARKKNTKSTKKKHIFILVYPSADAKKASGPPPAAAAGTALSASAPAPSAAAAPCTAPVARPPVGSGTMEKARRGSASMATPAETGRRRRTVAV